MAQLVKNPPAVLDTWVWSLGQEDPLEMEMVTNSSILAWRLQGKNGETCWATVYGVTRVRRDSVTKSTKHSKTGLRSSVQFSRSVMSSSLWPHGLQQARPPWSSPTPGAYSNSCPLSQWCHPTISSSVIPFSSCPQSFPASGSFPMSQFFPSGGQSIGVSASASVLPMNIQDWFPLGWTGWMSLQSKELSSLLQHHSSKASILRCSDFFIVQLTSIHDYWKNPKLWLGGPLFEIIRLSQLYIV